jgi:hypothetical protein
MSGLIPRPGPGRYVLIYPEPDGMRVEVYEGTAMITESKLADGITVTEENLDAAVMRLVEVLRKLG